MLLCSWEWNPLNLNSSVTTSKVDAAPTHSIEHVDNDLREGENGLIILVIIQKYAQENSAVLNEYI